MKLSLAVIAISLVASHAFMAAPDTRASTQLNAASMDRRQLFTNAAALTVSGVLVAPNMAFAADYEPKAEDMKQIYFLGASLDKLVAKLGNPDTVETALDGVRMFNKDPNFYPGYAKNFVLKSIKKGGDSDVRVGYIKQACALVGSVETVMAGGAALADAGAADEAIKRVKKAQALIAKFLEESGVKDEKFDAYIASHK